MVIGQGQRLDLELGIDSKDGNAVGLTSILHGRDRIVTIDSVTSLCIRRGVKSALTPVESL